MPMGVPQVEPEPSIATALTKYRRENLISQATTVDSTPIEIPSTTN